MMGDTAIKTNSIVKLSNIDQSYDGGESFIIKGLDLEILDKDGQGELIAILGMSGCGKSTVLRYIAGLQQPTAGEVFLKGKPVTDKERCGMIFQQYSSLPWLTVLENVALSLKFKGISDKERKDRAREMIVKVGLEGHENKYAVYPTLSGGQLQRVAIARSLLANPEILLMDEPFGALDISTRLQMQDLLLKVWAEFRPTIIFVTHDIPEAVYLAEDIHIMKYAPSKFVEHIPIDLGLERNRLTKRDPHFTELVHEVEDRMIKVANMG